MRFADTDHDLLTPEEMAAISGYDFLCGILAGTHAPAPIALQLGYRLDCVEQGDVTFRAVTSPTVLNPSGVVHGGWFGTLLDSCMGCAVQSVLPAGRGYTTLEYKINILRSLRGDGTEVLARGTIDHVGRRTGVATGRIIGAADGRLYATGSTTCLVFEM